VSVLSDSSIIDACTTKDISIDPFTLNHVQPASYDLQISLREPLVMEPNKFYLLSSLETVKLSHKIRGEVHGRSSVGRKAVLIHFTAGYIDPGFEGQITFEAMAFEDAFLVMPGDRLAQIAFTWLDRPATRPYTGRYQGQMGPTPSKFEHGDR
jgi:dCTP deaminase